MATGSIPHFGIEFEYEGNHGSEIYNSSWTAPYSGVAVASATWNNARGSGWWYIHDTTIDKTVCNITTTDTNNLTHSGAFPVIKGHTYKTRDKNAIIGANCSCFKIKIVREPD